MCTVAGLMIAHASAQEANPKPEPAAMPAVASPTASRPAAARPAVARPGSAAPTAQASAPSAAQAPATATPGQAPAPAAAPAAQPARQPVTPAQLVNIKIVVNVVEEGGGQPLVQKATSLTLADRQSGSVRATASRTERTADGREQSVLYRTFVDALPVMQRDGRVQVQLTLEHGRPGSSSIRVEPLLESGKTLVVSESTDPTSDRRTRVELTGTVLK
jgi:hypothetical protein